MGANRALRRQQEKQRMKEWVRSGQAEKVRSLQRNGITQKDLDDAYNDGYKKGYDYAATAFFRQMYAAIAKELYEAGNGTDEILSFLHGVDHRFAIMFDADDEINEVFDLIGVRINVYNNNSIDRISEVTKDDE